ncbi:sensor histidine kinase [Geoalkalibacter sp.]|uniref:sensor histidine kinase n=1 Tax=Geoalkalibacter sp. TaxID=3041440 RepID=UPI00272EDF72|nr:hybrid sensor histidine kinase/response regulator [Geoalkalibacter sp.]
MRIPSNISFLRDLGIFRIWPGGIQARLYLLIALVMLPMALLLGWTNYQHYRSLRRIELQTEVEAAKDVADVFATFVQGIQQQLITVGQAILTFSPYTPAKATKLLTDAASKLEVVRDLSMLSPDGTVLASSLPSLIRTNLAFHPYFKEIHGGRTWILSDLYSSNDPHQASTFAIAMGVRNENGSLLCVIVAELGVENLQGLKLIPARTGSGKMEIFDRQGTLVHANPDSSLTWEQRAQRRADDALLRRVLQTRQEQVGLLTGNGEEDQWIAARVPIAGLDWVVGAARPERIAFQPLRKLLIQESLLAGGMILGAFLLASVLARSISAPIQRLEEDAQTLGEGRIIARDDLGAPAEVNRLRLRVTDMATALIQAKTTAEDANRTKTEFMANMSHELRTPMTVIMGSVEYLQHIETETTKRELLGFVYDAGQRLLAIIDDLLDFSRIEAGRLKIVDVEFDLAECVRSAVEMFAKRAEEKGLRLTWAVHPLLPSRIKGDPHRLGQVLVNLVGNAVKFTEHGEVSVRVKKHADHLLFVVRDTGIGIAASHVDLIFQPFTQVDGSMTRRYEGTGLGLAICKDLVEMMGGTIQVTSREGQESVFSFSLPLRPATGKASGD